MIISKRTVGPELLSDPGETLVSTLLARGEGSREGGKRSGSPLHRPAADFENRAPVEAGRPFLEIKVP